MRTEHVRENSERKLLNFFGLHLATHLCPKKSRHLIYFSLSFVIPLSKFPSIIRGLEEPSL
jgi:hypothetical protein